MSKLEQTYSIKAPIQKVWGALTDSKVAEEWGAGPAKVDAVEGGEFSYWDGDIYGVFTKIVPEKLIEQDWYGHDHPGRKFKASYAFEAGGDDSTIIHFVHIGERDNIQKDLEDWNSYYFDPIKQLLEQ